MNRIPCINPRCRRTAPASRYEPGEEIICRPCFRLLPKSVADRYRTLNKRERRLLRLIDKRLKAGTISADFIDDLQNRFEARRTENWLAMRAFFRPADRPEGIDAFLEEFRL